jgi:aspartate/methionine/tyrosine aminotransferase
MSLARDNVPGGYNLAVGEPFFLQKIYGALYPKIADGAMQYPPMNGDADLINLIKPMVSHQNVVVTNGAKQAILAAMYALQKVDPNLTQIFHQVPYWPTYPTLAELSNLSFATLNNSVTMLNRGVFARILTSPNNPDGNIEPPSSVRWDIWDAAYASPIYGWDRIVPHHKMSVWSAAKLFGVSSYRIGWLATADKELARHAAEYVEKTTSGVSVPSQRFLYHFLGNLNVRGRDGVADLETQARMELVQTSGQFLRLEPLFREIRGFPRNGQGMFAWVQPFDPVSFREVLVKAKVKAVSGHFCGADSSWFRFSLGLTADSMEKAVNQIIANL